MKKLLALLLALALCLTMTGFAFAEAEEEATDETTEDTADVIPEVENEIAFEAQDVAMGATGITLKVPADWVGAASEDGSTMTYTSADGKCTVTFAAVAMDLDTVYEQCQTSVTDGKSKTVGEAYVNGVYYILLDVDDLTSVAYTGIDDTMSLLIQFTAADVDAGTASKDTALQILGSLTAPEAAAETAETAETEEATDGE